MAHGVTNLMRNIRRPGPKVVFGHEPVVAQVAGHMPETEDVQPTRHNRRHYSLSPFGCDPQDRCHCRSWPKDLQQPAVFGQYVNPKRDLRKGRRLRRELRHDAL